MLDRHANPFESELNTSWDHTDTVFLSTSIAHLSLSNCSLNEGFERKKKIPRSYKSL